MIVHTERRGRKVRYVDRAEYRFEPSFDEFGRFVIILRAVDNELVRLESSYLMFRLREGATEHDVKNIATHLELFFEDAQMTWVESPDGGTRMPVLVPIEEAA